MKKRLVKNNDITCGYDTFSEELNKQIVQTPSNPNISKLSDLDYFDAEERDSNISPMLKRNETWRNPYIDVNASPELRRAEGAHMEGSEEMGTNYKCLIHLAGKAQTKDYECGIALLEHLQSHTKHKTSENKINGPFNRFYFKDEKTLVITGNSQNDLSILKESQWSQDAFGTGVKSLTIISGECMDFKATTRLQRELSERERKYIEQYGVIAVVHKMSNFYDIYFESKEKMERAIKLEYMLAGGLSFKIQEWKKPLRIRQCNVCLKFGHYGQGCKGAPVCMYCAETNPNHVSKECPQLGVSENHRCHICTEMKVDNKHYSGDKNACAGYKAEYNYQSVITGNSGQPLLNRENYHDLIANGLVMQKWMSMKKDYNPADYTMIIRNIFPNESVEQYIKRKEEVAKKSGKH